MAEKKRKSLFPGSPTSMTEDKVLFYAISPADKGVVFARPERARYVSSLYKAMNAKTWGKFKSRLPAEEWARIAEYLADDDRSPAPNDPLESQDVPGFCDGDWPPWLQQEMHEVLPPDILQNYAKKKMSVINGDYWRIESEDLPAILKALEDSGIRAVEAPDLTFH